MKILQFFYDNYPKIQSFKERKVQIQSNKNLIIKGGFASGKKNLILNFLSFYKNENILFIDCADLRFDEKSLLHLNSFLTYNPQIKFLILCNFCYEFDFNVLKHLNLQIILSVNMMNFKLDNFEEIYLDFLDFEEFLSLNKKYVDIKSMVSYFLHTGRNVIQNQEVNFTYLKSFYNPLELNILKFIALNISNEFSTNDLFKSMKEKMQISKDTLYKNIAKLEQNYTLYFVKNYDKNVKKVYFYDFYLKNALSIQKDFSALFENLVLNEMFKFKQEIFYTKYFDFYIPNLNIAFLCSPFKDKDLILLKIKKILSKNHLKLSSIFIITLSQSAEIFINGIRILLLPFDEWALGN
ncbi:ATP-binding protein [Campylobacter insulaenigrae]|uniref:ATP-binding protein n=1 Tax=Campylobacter insulaenigrae TaxID=260714 RepID=A0ABY3G9I7_9BACT|nr:ATP-binding protein [Campylobacter insulaenigrae]MCR6574005.1 ATP-binding protein [Campylobacter insulaenigrae]MCR6575178.1 ATP-binding protein [Campylobacter insulaenigrae]MCR6579606.1 ATP-binding protein [Campylobacter insulaenigrae]MCR6582924.1 ATP-binding protein [Campylobacter insulaenigrae]MCR6584683.1 ATP-binding protein [Campylobacter insulaenigrae]